MLGAGTCAGWQRCVFTLHCRVRHQSTAYTHTRTHTFTPLYRTAHNMQGKRALVCERLCVCVCVWCVYTRRDDENTPGICADVPPALDCLSRVSLGLWRALSLSRACVHVCVCVSWRRWRRGADANLILVALWTGSGRLLERQVYALRSCV